MRLLKTIWFVICVLVLLLWLVKFRECAHQTSCLQSEVFVYLVLPMFGLAFPVAWVAGALSHVLVFCVELLGFKNLEILEGMLFWLATVALGYFRWFVVIPLMWRKSRRLKLPKK